MKNPDKRGNDIIGAPQGNCDYFEHYHGPCGGDVRQSIRGPRVDNRDEPGGDGPIPVSAEKKRPRNNVGKDL